MLKSELFEIIANSENSGIEFKRDDVRPEQMAKEIVAFANLQGGRILIGVEDDGTISGLQRENTQEWVMNTFRDKVYPQIIPFYEEIIIDDDKRVAIITISPGISKPYMVKHNNREEIYIRMGDRSELASREQQLRLFESGGLLHVETLPVSGTKLHNLDLERLRYYLSNIINDPDVPKDENEWTERLLGLGFMNHDGIGNTVCTIAGLICFGIKPRRFLGQAGLRLVVFDAIDKEYQAKLDIVLDAPLVGRWNVNNAGHKELLDEGLIEKFAEKVTPYIQKESDKINEHMRREKIWIHPWDAVRETVINALAHRDWTRTVDIEIIKYTDRLEVISPGKLPNTMTVRKMIAGQRSPRNTIIMEVLKDYAYVDARGMGVRTKIIPLVKELNKTEPLFEPTEDYLKTVLPIGNLA